MKTFLNTLLALLILWSAITVELATITQIKYEIIGLGLLTLARMNYRKLVEFLTANSY